MFGSTALTSHYEEFRLTEDIVRVSLCCQGCGNATDVSFVVEGISLQQVDGIVHTVSVNACSEWTAYPLEDRLIGFRMKTAMNNIPSLTPIIDTHDCSEEDTIEFESATGTSNYIRPMQCFVNGPPVIQDLTELKELLSITTPFGHVCHGFVMTMQTPNSETFVSLSADQTMLILLSLYQSEVGRYTG